jgi:hypothetical protein
MKTTLIYAALGATVFLGMVYMRPDIAEFLFDIFRPTY